MCERKWKEIPEYRGAYSVSNDGLVRSNKRLARVHGASKRNVKERILRQSETKKGYMKVSLWLNNKGMTIPVHRLVASAFVKGWKPGLVVNHKDGNKLNNNADNLEWVTVRENTMHAFSNGICVGSNTGRFGHMHCNPKSGKAIMPCGDILIFKSQADVIREFGLTQSKFSEMLSGKRGSHKGWKRYTKVALGVITDKEEAGRIVREAMGK